MYQTLLVGEKEKDIYNGFISSAPKPHFLQTYEWGELKKGTGWEPFRLLITKNKEPLAAVSLLKRNIPFFQRAIFYAPRGPILGKDCSQEDKAYFWQAVKTFARSQKAIFIKFDPDIITDDEDYQKDLKAWGLRSRGTEQGFGGVQPRYVFRLDIASSEDELLAAMQSKTRYNLRLAKRKGVTVRIAQTEEELSVFYRLLEETAQRDHFLIRSYSYYQDIWRLFVIPGTAKIFLADYQGEILAGTLAFYCGNLAWYLYGASGNFQRNLMPNYLLQWEMIRWARSLGCEVYDFRGVPKGDQQDDPLYGLYRFKKGFGAQFTEFIGEYDLVLSPFWYLLWTEAYPRYAKFSRRHLQDSSED